MTHEDTRLRGFPTGRAVLVDVAQDDAAVAGRVAEGRGEMGDTKAVEVRAEVRQVKTMADRTVNVILNLPEDCMEQVKVLLDWLGLEVGVIIVNGEVTRDNGK